MQRKIRLLSPKSSLFLMALIFLCMVVYVRFRLFGLPLERDEGEYAYMAQQLLQGVLPYTESQSLKFPGIFFVYAGILGIFGHTTFAIHFSLLLVNLATAFLLFLLGKNLIGWYGGIAAGVGFSVLTLSPTLQGLWANSEHFVLFPAVGGILLLRVAQEKPIKIFFSGFFLGFALMIKQHALFFCLFGILCLGSRVAVYSFKKTISFIGLFVAGGLAPISGLVVWYAITGNFSNFWFCTIQYASEYVSLVSLDKGFENFKYNLAPILESNFTILWFTLFGLVSTSWRKIANQEFLFLLGFFICSFLAATPGLYFRPHYFILWMPSLSLLMGLGLECLVSRFPSGRFNTVIPVGFLTLVLALPVWIQREFYFVLSINEATRVVYGLNPFTESLEAAKYIRDHSGKDDKVAVLGSEPQIYFYSQRRSATRHLYIFPLMEKHAYSRKMQKEMIWEIEVAVPKFVVVVKLLEEWASPDSAPQLLDWEENFLKSDYEIAGVIDIVSHYDVIYKWEEQARGYSPKSRFYLLIYKRRA